MFYCHQGIEEAVRGFDVHLVGLDAGVFVSFRIVSFDFDYDLHRLFFSSVLSWFGFPAGNIYRFRTGLDLVLDEPGQSVFEPICVIPLRIVFAGMSPPALFPV